MNPTTVWSALSVAQAVAGGIAWIDPSTFQPNVDALNLYWDSTNLRMSVKTAGDYSGTDAVNAGANLIPMFQMDLRLELWVLLQLTEFQLLEALDCCQQFH
jgi:hypothetical protein